LVERSREGSSEIGRETSAGIRRSGPLSGIYVAVSRGLGIVSVSASFRSEAAILFALRINSPAVISGGKRIAPTPVGTGDRDASVTQRLKRSRKISVPAKSSMSERPMVFDAD
jgi:hypothetical protein